MSIALARFFSTVKSNADKHRRKAWSGAPQRGEEEARCAVAILVVRTLASRRIVLSLLADALVRTILRRT